MVLDASKPPLDLLSVIGPDAMREGDPMSSADALAYCQGLATSHYENFSVLTSLVPERLRDDFAAVYAFCRWADDLGDETGSTDAARQESERLLAWWRSELHKCFGPGDIGPGGTGVPPVLSTQGPNSSVSTSARTQTACSAHIPEPQAGRLCHTDHTSYHPVFIALRETARKHPHLTAKPFEDLIDAFVQDQRVGIESNPYRTWDQIVDYCTRSANPVGRIVLTLGGYAPPEVDGGASNADRYAMSDATCTALQLINFWQDVRRDLLERDRVYIPEDAGITRPQLREWVKRPDDPAARVPYIRAIRPLVDRTAELFDQGRPLPGTLDPDLAPVVWLFGAGGDAILSAVRHIGCATLWQRPKLSKATKAMLVGRAWCKKKLGGGGGGGGGGGVGAYELSGVSRELGAERA